MAGDSNELVLVTGASGYLGTHVVQQLLRDTSYRVRASVRDTNSSKAQDVRNIAKSLGQAAVDRLELVSADLLKAESWPSAVEGCTFVIHVAAVVDDMRKSEIELIKAALDGTLNVLQACKGVKSVNKVVLTSSIAAIFGDYKFAHDQEKVFTESDWADPDKSYGYNKGKTLAERAAWDFVEKLEGEEKFELVVICPGLITGPVLSAVTSSTMDMVQGLMSGKYPALPKITIPPIDVRDVAKGHVIALTNDQVVGKRVIMTSNSLSNHDIAVTLHTEFSPQGYSVATRQIPSGLVRFVGFCVPKVRHGIVPILESEPKFDNGRMKEVLGVSSPIDSKRSVIDMANSMIEFGQVKRKGRTPAHADTNPQPE